MFDGVLKRELGGEGGGERWVGGGGGEGGEVQWNGSPPPPFCKPRLEEGGAAICKHNARTSGVKRFTGSS